MSTREDSILLVVCTCKRPSSSFDDGRKFRLSASCRMLSSRGLVTWTFTTGRVRAVRYNDNGVINGLLSASQRDEKWRRSGCASVNFETLPIREPRSVINPEVSLLTTATSTCKTFLRDVLLPNFRKRSTLKTSFLRATPLNVSRQAKRRNGLQCAERGQPGEAS